MIPETTLSANLGLPIKTLRQWRQNGTLLEAAHWKKTDSGTIGITADGLDQIKRLMNLPEESDIEPDVPAPTHTLKVARNQGRNPRLLRCLLIDPIDGIGPRVSVRLCTPRVSTRHFRPGTEIAVSSTDTPDIFEYHGPKPIAVRI
jgi:hypothetical protein